MKSAYDNLLIDIRYCLNLLKDLETDRTWGEFVTDWFAGDRSKLNIPRMSKQLVELKEEIEKGSKVYTKLFVKLNGFKLMEKFYFHKSGMLTHVANEDSDEFDGKLNKSMKGYRERFSQIIGHVNKTITFKPKDEDGIIATLDTNMSAMFLVLSGLELPVLLGYIGYRYAKAKGKDRGIKYEELQFLSDSLNEPRLLAIFQTCHGSLQDIIDEIDSQIETYRKDFGSIPQIQEIGDSEKPHIQAMKFYKNAKSTNLLSLEDEPELTPAMRTKMAIRISKAECKVFLTEKLNYSETEVEEFIDCLPD